MHTNAYTINSRYIPVIYDTQVHTAQQLKWKKKNWSDLHSRTATQTLPLQASSGVSCDLYHEELLRYIESSL